jgi:predicted dehydrogenase
MVSAVVDRDSQRITQFGRNWPNVFVARNLTEVLERNLADVIHICTPAATHEQLAEEALASGRHVLVEKPLAESPESTARLLQLAETKQLLLCPVHQMLFQRGIFYIQAAMENIGPLLHVDAVICSAGAENSAESPDLVVADILPGPLSVVAKFVPGSIRNVRWEVEHAANGELRATALAGRATTSVLISMNGRPTVNSLRLIGERGTAYADLFHGFSIVEPGGVSRSRKITHPFDQGARILCSATANLLTRAFRREPAYPGLRELIRRFYEAADAGSHPPISAAETLDVALARQSILEGMRLRAPRT